MAQSAAKSYRWKPIEDLPQDHRCLSESELGWLAGVWLDQKEDLQSHTGMQQFNQRLLRRWAIETGIIERIYTLERGVAQMLVERGLEAALIPHGATDMNPELVIRIIRDQYNAVDGLFDFVAARRSLSTAYIKELQAVLTANQETTEAVDTFGNRVEVTLIRGDYKTRPNNPSRQNGTVHEYCPPEQVASEMDRLVEMHRSHEEREVSAEVESAWLHHRFTQIHPFQDGNGRVARALATLVFLRQGWLPLVIIDDYRGEYISALEEADHGDLAPLVRLFARIEKRALLQALSIAEEVRQQDRKLHHAVQAIRETYQQRHRSLRAEWDRSKETAQALLEEASATLKGVATELQDQLAPLAPPENHFKFFVDPEPAGGKRGPWFRYQLIQLARKFEYFANFAQFHSWVRLVAETETKAEILLSFHGIGTDYRGLLIGTGCFLRMDVSGEEQIHVSEVNQLCDEPFQINYKEPQDEALQRFQAWLSPVVVKGLEMLRRSV